MSAIEEDVINSKTSFGIRGKLFLGFTTISIVLLIAVLASLYIISSTEDFSKNVINRELPIYSELVDLNGNVLLAQNALQAWVITNDAKYKSEFTTHWDYIQKSKLAIQNFIQNDQGELHTNLQTINSLLDNLKESQDKVFASSDKAYSTQILISETSPTFFKLATLLNTIDSANEKKGMIDVQNDNLTKDAHVILSDMASLKIFEYAILILGFILTILITLITARKILPPLNNAIRVAKKIAAGKRDVKIPTAANDETGQLLTSLKTMQKEIKDSEEKLLESEANTRQLFEKIVNSAKMFSAHSSRVAAGDLREHLKLTEDNEEVMIQLGNDLNKMTENLASITKEITQACQNMVAMVDEVHHAVDAQSSGATEQASSVNEITASLGEIEKSSAQTMAKAKALGESAKRTREKGQQGLEAVDQSVLGMKSVRDKVQTIAQTILDLSNQTQQIGEITAVVNNLAQQSKMLALNASIEAAKAGEAGKGFAVVAGEVKNLAEQSEQATTQVQKILEDIQRAADKAVIATDEGTKGVDTGTELVEQTGGIIRNLNDVIHETSIATQQIEAAVRQESAGIEQITAGMSEINQVTASFVESVKQTTEAISNLAEIARGLKSYVDTYKL